jgi:CRISPR/Cas system CSM-associated protein Csm3 (group 7 of RAMP superfamily)
MSASSPARIHSQLHIARVVLEAVTPLSISTGSPDGVFDSALVRDANDLPAIPATSLAGVLRNLYTQQHGSKAAQRLFGYQHRDDLFGSKGQRRFDAQRLFGYQHRDDGAASRLHVGWGHLLDSRGRAACGLLLGREAQRLRDDPLLADVMAQQDNPNHRNRVRLTHRGAAADTGKFDRTVLPAGHRFAVELRLWTAPDETDDLWQSLLSLLGHPGLRLGGGVRAGLGRMHCIRLHTGRFDLRQPAQAQALARLGADPSATQGLDARPIPQFPVAHWLDSTLSLDARPMPQFPGVDRLDSTLSLDAHNLWRIGQGDVAIGNIGPDDKTPDLLPVTERRVVWNNGRGQVNAQRELLLPATSLKGVLAHRIAFHARRFAGRWADQEHARDRDGHPIPPPEVLALFGQIKDKAEAGQAPQGWAGCLFIDDTYLPIHQSARLMHNSIDRFTGGVREHMLFEEENVYGGQATVHLSIDLQRLKSAASDHGTTVAAIQKAFVAALRDLGEGRLALGARSTSGNGFFRADIPPELTTAWPEPTSPQLEAA